MARLQNLDVSPDKAAAKVILNARTGSIVMNQMVTLQSCAVAHGNLSVVVNTQPVVSQPGPFSNGQTVVAAVADPAEAGQRLAEDGDGRREPRRRREGTEHARRDAGRPDVDPAGDEGGGALRADLEII
jgi:hypothetical protein